MRRRVDGGIPQGDRPDEVAQLEPRKRRAEHHQDVTAAARRDVGDVPAAEPLKQLAELGALALNLGRRGSAAFMVVMDSSIVNAAAGAGRVKVKSQEAPGTARRVVHRHSARLQRRLGGQRTGPPRRVCAAAVLRRPDVRRTRERGRDRMPRSLRGGAREAVRSRVRYIRRVARGQWRTDRATCYCGHGCWLSVRPRVSVWRPLARSADERVFGCAAAPLAGAFGISGGYRAPGVRRQTGTHSIFAGSAAERAASAPAGNHAYRSRRRLSGPACHPSCPPGGSRPGGTTLPRVVSTSDPHGA